MDINYQLPQIQRFPGLSEYTRQTSLQALAPPPALSNSAMNAVNQQRLNLFKLYLTLQNKNLLLGQAISSLTGQLSNQVSEGIFGTDTELGQAMGNLFSTGINTAGDQVVNNIFKGESLMNGMGQSVGSSLAGAGAGMAANYIGKGISSLGGNSKLSRGIGAGFATGAGTLGGTMASNLVKGQSLFNGIKGMNTANLVGLGASIVGSGLQAAFGPSKEYGGTYGNITKGMDTAYDLIQGAAGFIPGVGTAVSGFMALNKGLSNVFGSTSGMTRQDAILGSAFMPAPVKWLNMAGAKTTDKFRNQSWLNQERTNTFMQNGFGDLGEKFDKARRESGKTYGTFSRHAYNKAQGNLNFANDAFNKILDMADDEELRRIRSEYMTSINNQRYAQDIMGGFHPLYRGKQGMKIPEINHNFGQRLLSGAALIDNKQMILSAQSGNKIFATNSQGDSYYVSPSALTSNEVNVTIPETFITANPDDVATGNAQRWWREHSNVHNEKGLKQVSPEFDLITLSPLLKPVVNTGLRSAGRIIGKAGNLVKVPNKNSLKGFSFNDLPQEKYVYNKKTGDFDVIAPKKEWIQKGENELVPDYFVSPQEKERLIATGISPEEALDIMDVRWINSIEALPGKLRCLGKNTFGDAQNINGRAFVRYNSRKGVKASLNNASTTLNTVFHELGGHGSSLNIGYGTQTIPINMKDILMKIYKHNESLRPLLKPFYQAVKDGNFDLAKSLAKDEGIELSSLKGSSGNIDFKSLKDFIKYMEENLEYSARAIGSNMSNHYGMPNGWNEKQLRDIFTKESVDNLLKNVWNYGVPITTGVSTAATLYNKSK